MYCTFQVRLSRLPADISEKQIYQGSPQRKPKPASPSRTPVEKTSLGTRELNELLTKELNRKKEVTKKKSFGSSERKTMKQLKALAQPVLGTTAVETALSSTMSSSVSAQPKQRPSELFKAERTPEKPTFKMVDKPKQRPSEIHTAERTPEKLTFKLVDKPKERLTAEKPTKERPDSPAGNAQSELSAEETLVQESMIQAMLQQHNAMQQLGQSQANLAAAAALASASTGGLDCYNPYASLGMHPMWSMYSPTFAGSGGGLPMMDLNTAAAFGYLSGMAGTAQSTTPSPTKSSTTSGKKQSGGSAIPQTKKTPTQDTIKKSQVREKKSANASVGVRKTPTSSLSSQQGVKRPRSPAKTLSSVKMSLDDNPPAKRSVPMLKSPGETKSTVKVTHGVPNVPSRQPQTVVRGSAQRGRVGLQTGQPYRKPFTSTTQSMHQSPRHGSTTISKPTAGAAQSQPRKVYPVDVDLTSPPRRVPPPAHGGTGAVRRAGPTYGVAGLDFSRPAAKPHPPSPPSSDDDVIVLDDSD